MPTTGAHWTTYGSVLTRALPGPVHACATCRGAAGNDYKFCPACNGRYGQGKTPRLGFCLYAVKGAQLYRSLFAYKESGEARYVQDARQLIRGVLYFAFADHYRCLEAQEGSVDAWCIVPSLRSTVNTKSVDHALSRIASKHSQRRPASRAQPVDDSRGRQARLPARTAPPRPYARRRSCAARAAHRRHLGHGQQRPLGGGSPLQGGNREGVDPDDRPPRG